MFWGVRRHSHRVVAEYSLGPCPEGHETRHLCGRGSAGCVTAPHLRYGTRSENAADKRRLALKQAWLAQRKGKITILSQEEADVMRAMRNVGIPSRTIAEVFGVSHSHACNVLAGRRWR